MVFNELKQVLAFRITKSRTWEGSKWNWDWNLILSHLTFDLNYLGVQCDYVPDRNGLRKE